MRYLCIVQRRAVPRPAKAQREAPRLAVIDWLSHLRDHDQNRPAQFGAGGGARLGDDRPCRGDQVITIAAVCGLDERLRELHRSQILPRLAAGTL